MIGVGDLTAGRRGSSDQRSKSDLILHVGPRVGS